MTIAAYFVVPAAYINKMRMDINNGDVLISSGELDPAKYYEVVSAIKDLQKYPVKSVFTGIGKDITNKGVVKEVKIISSGKLDPTKYYEVMKITGYIGDYVVGDRLTGISIDITGKSIVKEISSTYPLVHSKFDAVIAGVADTGGGIVHALLKRHWVKEIKRLSRSDDATSTEALEIANLKNIYIGKTKEDVFKKFPELAGFTGTGEDAVPRFKENRWTCE